MDEFVALHQVQLLASNIPEHLWESLYLKLKFEVPHTLYLIAGIRRLQ